MQQQLWEKNAHRQSQPQLHHPSENGLGLFTNSREGVATPHAVPAHGWAPLGAYEGRLPTVHTFREDANGTRGEL